MCWLHVRGILQGFVATAACQAGSLRMTDQHLQVQLWRHAHVELHVQVMVVRDEGSGCGASRDHIHHRRFHLHMAPSGVSL